MTLVNLLRILGAVKTKKASHHFVTRPTQVILLLSLNHGLFGNDGLYLESKISLEMLFNRWNSESWSEYCAWLVLLSRGPAVQVSWDKVERHSIRTFSAKEMVFNILGMMHPLLLLLPRLSPSGLTSIVNELRRAIMHDNALDFKVINEAEDGRIKNKKASRHFVTRPMQVIQSSSSNHRTQNALPRPSPPNYESFAFVNRSIKLEVHFTPNIPLFIVFEFVSFPLLVKTKYGVYTKLGPWGSSRTRWEMEARGEFTVEGCIEMAWLIGHIKHVDGHLKDGSLSHYEKEIMSHAGVRVIEPELFCRYDPKKKVFNQEIELIHDLEPVEVAQSEAEKFKYEYGDKCNIWTGEGDQWFVKFKKGARIFVPKAFKFSRLVADIIAQTDRATLWALVCTAEALNVSGITDPYELYKYFHPSEVGTFINTTAIWINLLQMSSSGPVKIPVGACATALQSLDIASSTLLSGKAKVMVASRFDDISEEDSYEFANMKATSNAELTRQITQSTGDAAYLPQPKVPGIFARFPSWLWLLYTAIYSNAAEFMRSTVETLEKPSYF
ncbi:hypothetical protein BD769DRAFT_1716175 [Suillus cothurnatus]|nr:hypothetical protein BD769DRAFT_1716175 [Suillus cothurnatus]